jgi:hypothetical protein
MNNYNIKKIITIFGSSIPKEGDEEYKVAYQLGKMFAQAGFDICNGGNHGIMEASAKGALEHGAKTIGVTVDAFISKPNKYITEQIHCKTLFERIEKLISCGNAFVILQGGTGTLVELAIVWELINKGIMKAKPVACYSKLWNDIVPLIEEQIKKEKRKTGLVNIFNEPVQLAEFIIKRLNN